MFCTYSHSLHGTGIPVSHEVTINHGSKPLTAIDIDDAGARIVTGSYDTNLKLWDFAAMDARMKSFRQVVPSEGNQVRCVKFSNTGTPPLYTCPLVTMPLNNAGTPPLYPDIEAGCATFPVLSGLFTSQVCVLLYYKHRKMLKTLFN